MHIPVLQKEVIYYLNPKPNENFIDCTLGSGGHTMAILEKNGPRGKVLGIDWDPAAIERTKSLLKKSTFKNRLTFINDNFVHLKDIVKKNKFRPVHGILFDLGMSLDQLLESGRGFSFQKNEVLDMRYNPENLLDAKKILNFWSRQDIEKILKEYGEEQFASSIAKAVVQYRSEKPITRTMELIEIIRKSTPRWYQRQKINPATKTFQALRIAVNNELENLSQTLPQAVFVLSKGGRIVVISFHSLEDRIVKNFFKNSTVPLKILTKKPIVPSPLEIKQNPKARSAKLRAAIKI